MAEVFKLDPAVEEQLASLLDKTDQEFDLDPKTKELLEKVLARSSKLATAEKEEESEEKPVTSIADLRKLYEDRD